MTVTGPVVRPAAERYLSAYDGVETRHCFSAGAHYDPANVSFGPVVAVDEHRVAPGAGFDWHAHHGVRIWSWVLAGTLRHQDGTGDREVGPGELVEQDATDGLRHRETNPGPEPLHLVQTTVLADTDVRVRVEHGAFSAGPAHLFVTAGGVVIDGRALAPGDSVRVAGKADIEGDGDVLVVEWN